MTDDPNRSYFVESVTGCLLLGDVMAVLAECQNRQECDIDRWTGHLHYAGHLCPILEWRHPELTPIIQPKSALGKLPDNVSIKVAVEPGWSSGIFPAFSLRCLYPRAELGKYPNGGSRFLHELIVHKMIHDGVEYKWEPQCFGLIPMEEGPVCNTGKYEANLLAVKEQ